MSQNLYMDSSNFKAAGLTTTSLTNLQKPNFKKSNPIQRNSANSRDSVSSNHSANKMMSHSQPNLPLSNHHPHPQQFNTHPHPQHPINSHGPPHGQHGAPQVQFNPNFQNNLQQNYQALEIKYTNLLNQSKQKENFIKLLSKENKLLNSDTKDSKSEFDKLKFENENLQEKLTERETLISNINSQIRLLNGKISDNISKKNSNNFDNLSNFNNLYKLNENLDSIYKINELNLSSEISLSDSSIFSNSPLTPFDDDYNRNFDLKLNLNEDNLNNLDDTEFNLENEISNQQSQEQRQEEIEQEQDYNMDALAKLTNESIKSNLEVNFENLSIEINQLINQNVSIENIKFQNLKLNNNDIANLNDLFMNFIILYKEKKKMIEFFQKITVGVRDKNLNKELIKDIKFENELETEINKFIDIYEEEKTNEEISKKLASKNLKTKTNSIKKRKENKEEDENIYQTEFNKLLNFKKIISRQETKIQKLIEINKQEKKLIKNLSFQNNRENDKKIGFSIINVKPNELFNID